MRDKADIKNYRPVSLLYRITQSLQKIFELGSRQNYMDEHHYRQENRQVQIDLFKAMRENDVIGEYVCILGATW